jgi:hypothetical protein
LHPGLMVRDGASHLLTMRVGRCATCDDLILRSLRQQASRRMGRTKNDDTSPPSRDAFRPSFFNQVALCQTEGAGKTGCPSHPWSACNKKARGRTTGTSRQPAFPAQWFYGLYVISPVTRLCCHRRLASSAKLSANLGAPGPHDFAVHKSRVRLSRALASTASHRNVRDDRDPPLIRRETREVKPLICPTAQALLVRHVGTTGKLRMACMRELPVGQKTREPLPIREAAFASLKAPLRPVRAPVDPADASEGREASGRRRTLQCDSRKTIARPARSS